MADGHQHRTGMPPLPLQRHPAAAGARDVLDDADRYLPLLKDRPLLDVEFREGMIVTAWQPHRFQRSRAAGGEAEFIERPAFAVAQGLRLFNRDRPGHEPASKDVYADDSIDTIPVLYQGRFRPLDAAARLWLQETYHAQSIQQSDRSSFHLPTTKAADLSATDASVWPYLMGRCPLLLDWPR